MPVNRTPNCTCETCGVQFYRRPSRLARFCSQSCYRASNPTPNPRVPRERRRCAWCESAFDWLPGQGKGRFCSQDCWYRWNRRPTIDHRGYRRVWDGDRHVLEHRLVVERNLGRRLTTSEHVHHVNGDRLDNRIENLQVLTHAEHMRVHRIKARVERTCLHCGVTFLHLPGRGKGMFCSTACAYADR